MTNDYFVHIYHTASQVLRRAEENLSYLRDRLRRAPSKQERKRLRKEIQTIEGKRIQDILPTPQSPDCGLVADRLVNTATVWWMHPDLSDNQAARQDLYMPATKKAVRHLSSPTTGPTASPLGFSPDFSNLPLPGWIGFRIRFRLLTPWFSKDDRRFHVMDNPVRKDRLTGLPFMSAAAWKGLLRWTCRLRAGLAEHLRKHQTMNGWNDPPWVRHLFGHEKTDDPAQDSQQGALRFFPTWFDRIDFEVINPHDRARRAGTQPIHYEVVPAGTEGFLHILYAPVPGAAARAGVSPPDVLANLLDAAGDLLTVYGISAKRTSGWGATQIISVKVFPAGTSPFEKKKIEEVQAQLETRRQPPPVAP